MFDALEIVSRLATVLTEPRGARSDCQLILDELSSRLPVLYGFICTESAETDNYDVLAATGLDATTFRRLETRIGSSALVRVVDRREPIDMLVNDEPTLDFLTREGVSAEVLIVPLFVGLACTGFIGLAVDKAQRHQKRDMTRLMQIASTFIAQALKTDLIANEESRRIAEENIHLKQELKDKYDFANLIGNSRPMRQVYDQVTQVARSNATVLLRGESGTGKELIANAIHYNSLRSKRPLVKVNCGALPEALIDAALFGDGPRGDHSSVGRFEMAEGGTLFLDEIGDLPMQTQARLLRAVQEREFERSDASETVKTNVRLIVSTKKDLEGSIASGTFRDDLLYGINGFTIFLPPLRERKSDILLLADHFLERYSNEHGKRIRRITTPAIDMLTAYHFPGNVRELENAIERAVLSCDTNVIHGHHLPPTLQTAEVSGTETRLDLASAVAAFESDMIQDALKSSRGNVAKAAKMLDSTERILGYKIKKYGIDPSRFKRWSASNS